MRTVADYEKLRGKNALTPAEKKLIAAVRAGKPCALQDDLKTVPEADDNPAHTIRADLLALLITGGTPACGLSPFGVTLFGAYITSKLRLTHLRAVGDTVFAYCRFAEQPDLRNAHFQTLNLTGSHLPGLMAQGAEVGASLFLRGITATGTVDVNGAKIGGQLACEGATLNGAGGKALNAQGAEVGADLFLRGITATGTVDMKAAKIGGQLSCNGATLNGAGGMALSAQGAEVRADLFLTSITATGTVDAAGAKIGGQLDCDEAKLNGAGGKALNAQGAEVGASLFLRGITATGTFDVNGAEIGGQLDCKGATLDGAGSEAFTADGVEVRNGLLLHEVTATGTIFLIGAKIGGQLVCVDATLNGSGDEALIAPRTRVAEALVWKRVTVESGRVLFGTAHVGDLWDDVDNWPVDLILDGFTYERLIDTTTSAQKRLPWLKKGSFPNGTFTPQPYTHLAKVLREMGHDREARVVLMARNEILAREDLIAGYRKANGKPYLRFENPWKDLKYLGKWGLDLCLRYGVGYGYAPQRAVYVLIALIGLAWGMAAMTWHKGAFAPNSDVILVSQGWQDQLRIDCQPLYFTTCVENPAKAWSDDAANGMDWDSFHALGYAVDLVIPILNLGQTEAWAPSKDRGPWGLYLWWGRWVLIAAGWIISALGAAALTGIMQRDKDR